MSDSAQSLPDDDRVPSHSAPDADQPDWLVSSDQGAEDERRVHGSPAAPPPVVRLNVASDLSMSVDIERPKVPVRPDPSAPAEEERSQGPKPWTGAASSVPKLKVEPSMGSAPAPVSKRSEPAARRAEPESFDAPVPARFPAAAAADSWNDEDAEDSRNGGGFPDDTGPLAPVIPIRAQKLDEPFWVVALEALRSDRRILLGLIAAILLPLLAWTFWPRSEPGVSIHALHQEPARWDGQTVRLNGRVGDVFHVGVGWAYNLHQGRDTIVVFTRGAAPRTRDKITVVGSVSTGYLDGQPRQAIFQ